MGLRGRQDMNHDPSSIPRSESMTDMKCMHDDLSKGALAALVRCFTSTEEMFPTTLRPLSTTATLLNPSVFMRSRASASGLSALV